MHTGRETFSLCCIVSHVVHARLCLVFAHASFLLTMLVSDWPFDTFLSTWGRRQAITQKGVVWGRNPTTEHRVHCQVSCHVHNCF